MAAKMGDSDARDAGKRDQPRAKASLVDEACRKILAMMTGDALVGGERLPSKSEMAIHLSVSRPVLRHALSRLQHSGVAEVRWGAGTYAQNAVNVPPSDFNFGPVRALDRLGKALGSNTEAQEADLEFHLAISASSGNRFFLRTLQCHSARRGILHQPGTDIIAHPSAGAAARCTG